MFAEENADVLVIGAGPAGLMAALALSHLKIKVKIIDRRLPEEQCGRADGIQPRTIEVWDSLGIGTELRHLGTKVYQVQACKATYEAVENKTNIKLTNQSDNVQLPSARYPYEILAPIQVIEGIMQRDLATNHVLVDQPVVPLDWKLSPEESCEYPITVSLLHLSSQWLRQNKVTQEAREPASIREEAILHRSIIKVKYLIGCDGSKSWLRNSLGILMEGPNHVDLWGVLDCHITSDLPTLRAKTIIHTANVGMIGHLPHPRGDTTGRFYVSLPASPSKYSRSDTADTVDQIQAIVRQGIKPYQVTFNSISWCGVYKVAQKVANRFSHLNRVFIAGDACHTHSPSAGQGANASMTDAYNLAWKLAYVLQGWSKPSLLKTYEEERRMYSLQLIKFDQELYNLARNGMQAAEIANFWEKQSKFLTGLGTRYQSRLTVTLFQELAQGLQIGERCPPANLIRYCDWNPCNLHDLLQYNGKFKLLVFPGNITLQSSWDQFRDFANGLQLSLRSPYLDMLDIYSVLHVKKKASLYNMDVPACLGFPDNFYVYEEAGNDSAVGEVDSLLGIPGNVAVAALVRPDGHLCQLTPVASIHGSAVADYLTRL